jgi:predicted site-specific integrase-resolvase
MTAKADSPLPSLITARDLGRLLNRNRETILKWARDGLIPCYKTSERTIRFNEHEVAKKMRENGMKGGRA